MDPLSKHRFSTSQDLGYPELGKCSTAELSKHLQAFKSWFEIGSG